MKTIKTFTTALLIGISATVFAGSSHKIATTEPVAGVVVESPEFTFGEATDSLMMVEEAQPVLFFSAPDMEWGSASEVSAPFEVGAPDMEWGSPDEAVLVFDFPAFSFGEPDGNGL